MNVMSSFGPTFSVLELVDAAIPGEHLDSIKQTILQTEGVKVSFKYDLYNCWKSCWYSLIFDLNLVICFVWAIIIYLWVLLLLFLL